MMESSSLPGGRLNDFLSRLQAALADRYTIERELKRGGMALVFLARDLKHHRPVAIKVLRPELAAALGPERFVSEIAIAARLNHPHILPLHDSGEAGGFLYYVMPYVEGESLRDRLNREKQLPVAEALQVAREVASALDYAHRQGVLHRDIKPENILLADGRAVVADFGIARAVSAAGGQRITEAGVVVGTPTYMSLEQASADAVIDARSDIYSLGCVLYELLAGAPPYTGATPQAILARKATDPVPPLRSVRDTVPLAVEQAIRKALARMPADRFATAREFADALAAGASRAAPSRSPRPIVALGAAASLVAIGGGWWLVAHVRRPLAARTAIAVLPCENLSRKPDQEYVSDQVTEELIGRLSAVAALQVKSWLATQGYRVPTQGAPAIARELGVGTLVRCGVAQGAGLIDLRAQLIDANSDQVLWSEAYRRPLTPDKIFEVETVAAQHIAGVLNAPVSPTEIAHLARPPTQDLAALTAYRLGRHFWNMRTAQGLLKSIDYYRRAIAADSTFALAYVGLAEADAFLGQLTPVPPRQGVPPVKQLILRALALDETAAEAHSMLGELLLLYDWDWPSANREFTRAVALEPRSATAHVWYGQSLSYVGRHAEAIAESERAVELDPTIPFVVDNLAFRLYYAHRYDEALRTAQRSLELDSTHWVAHAVVGSVDAARGRYPEAIAALRQAFTQSGESAVALAQLGQVYGMAGRRAEAEAVLKDLSARAAAGYVPATYFAQVYVGLGDRDQAFAWLAKAYEERDYNLIWYLGGEPTFDGLRADSAYRVLRRRVGFPEWGR
ncbi:MAG TPA: protein kinase [Gemmatimonadales bacterium]|nr:protein kinase [Gemmatimonadales bacterium]